MYVEACMNSIFDIIGPIMIGPSSSHTAGAARLGKMARCIFRSTPKKVCKSRGRRGTGQS